MINIEDIDNEDYTSRYESPQNQPEGQPVEDDFIQDYLKTRGIDDMSKIKFENDNGEIEEMDWRNLSKQEKINILNTPLEVPQYNNEETDLSDEEINLLNDIRQKNMSPSQYLQAIKEQMEIPNQEPTYKIDDLSDDEIYLLDLESRVGELSEDESAQVLANAKMNEDFYKKQVEGIRKEYKEREDFQNQQQEAELEQQRLEEFNQYKNQIFDAIDSFNSVGNLDISLQDTDKERLAEFMLSQQEDGTTELYKALQNPVNQVKCAWFILNGDATFNSVSDYFIKQIKMVSDQYKKAGAKPSTPESKVVIQKPQNKPKTYSSIEDLDD